MILKGSYLTVSDNSGAKKVQCIHVLRNSRRRYARIGDTVLVSAKKVKHAKKIVKKKIYRALIISTAKGFRRPKGRTIRFRTNRILLLSDQNKFLGTRVDGPICREIRGGKKEIEYKKIISYARSTV
jgi:large subunit ribosomal protein L14